MSILPAKPDSEPLLVAETASATAVFIVDSLVARRLVRAAPPAY